MSLILVADNKENSVDLYGGCGFSGFDTNVESIQKIEGFGYIGVAPKTLIENFQREHEFGLMGYSAVEASPLL